MRLDQDGEISESSYNNIKSCCSTHIVLVDKNNPQNDFKLLLRGCGWKECLYCKNKKAISKEREIRQIVRQFASRKMMTLTVKNLFSIDKKKIKHYNKCLNNLLFKYKKKGKIHRYLWTPEIKKTGRTWNYHFHLVIDADYIPVRELSKAWYKETKDSYIVDIRRIGRYNNNINHCVKYISKYFSKMPYINDLEDAYQWYLVSKGMRSYSASLKIVREDKTEWDVYIIKNQYIFDMVCEEWVNNYFSWYKEVHYGLGKQGD